MHSAKDIFLNTIAQTTPFPFLLEIEKAEGVFLYDKNGKKYYDLISGVSVSNLGHQHPHVIKAIEEQLHKHLHVMVYGEYVQSSVNKLSSLLASMLPESLNCIYFTNSGAECIEGALKLAKRYTARTEIISMKSSYHGSTHGALSVSGNEQKKYAFRPLLPDIRFIEFNNTEHLDQITKNTACVLIETIQGDAGIRIPSQEYLKALRAKCDENGALLIMDEIQSGMGRTGKLFAFEHYNIVPDILCTAKALGGGLPLGAFIANKTIMETLTYNPMLGHITTFGGNPLSCAAAAATLEVINNDSLLDKVESKGKLFEELIQHDSIVEIRRKGLFFAFEFDSEEIVAKIVERCLQNGVITFWFLSCKNSFRIAPPLTISESEIEECCFIINEAIAHSVDENNS